MAVRKGVVQSMRLKIVNPEHLEKEIREKASAFRSMADSTKKLKDLAIERMGGTVSQADIFQDQAAPVIEAIERANKGDPLYPKERAVGEKLKALLTQGQPLPEEQLTKKKSLHDLLTLAGAPVILPPPPPPILGAPAGAPAVAPPGPAVAPPGPAVAPPGPAVAPPGPAGAPPPLDPIKSLRTQARSLYPDVELDTTFLSIKANKNTGVLFLNGAQVAILGNNTLDVNGTQFPMSDGLAFLLCVKPRNGKEAEFQQVLDNSITLADWENYRDILAICGARITAQGNTPKANALKEYIVNHPDLSSKVQGLGRQPKHQSGRVVRGRFGALAVDEAQLGKGLFSAKDPSGNLVFHAKVSDGVRHLLKNSATKAQAGKGKYTEKDLATYHELAEMAGVHHKPTDVRRQLKNPAVKSAVFLPDEPKAQFDRLETLMGLHGQGNDNKEVKTEALMIADRLLKSRHLSKGQHKIIYGSLTDGAGFQSGRHTSFFTF